tara:strand:- start:215 stop:376 length:162 start_codon:yes stop_codon:yes gene_type:complete
MSITMLMVRRAVRIGVRRRPRSYDITAARTELGYRPAVNLTDGLAEMADSLSR